MKTGNFRPVYLIEKELREAMNKSNDALREGRYFDAAILTRQINALKDEFLDAQENIKYEDQNRAMDKHQRSFFAKILSLSLNEADMSLYHIDMFFSYMQDRGYVPVPEWERKRRELKKAITEYRDFVKHFFKDENNLINNEIDFMHLLDVVRDKMFTDREKVYYDKHEIKAGNNE